MLLTLGPYGKSGRNVRFEQKLNPGALEYLVREFNTVLCSMPQTADTGRGMEYQVEQGCRSRGNELLGCGRRRQVTAFAGTRLDQ